MPYLIFNSAGTEKRIKLLNDGTNTIGRDRSNTIVDAHMSLSRHHATIAVNSGTVTLADLNSRNGTFVNDCRIERCELTHNDSIRCGDVVFTFVKDLGDSEQEVADPFDANLKIVKRVSPESSRVLMRDLLLQADANESAKPQGSVLKLRQKDVNQRAVDKLQILLEVSKQLSSPEEPEKLLEKILNLLFEIMDVDRAAILMVNEASNQLERRAVKSGSGIPRDYQFYSKKITNLVRLQGEAVLTADASSDMRFEDSESVYGQSIRASMCVPLKPKDEVIGVLYVDNLSTSNVYSTEDLEFLTSLANQAAIAIENVKLYKKIETEAVMRGKFERFFPRSVSKKLKEEGDLEIIDTEVTSLFSDISNFTELSSTMAPRQVIAMLNEYFEVMVEDIVFRYEGTLEKYIGDALLAVWGAPYKKIDDADRAVRAAIAMQQAVRRLNEQWMQQRNIQIQIHIGINSGKVAAGNIGSQQLIQYATIGDTTNVTSRICNVAKAGEIVISQSTLDKLKDCDLQLRKMPPVSVKGKTEPLELYQLDWDRD